MLEKSFRSVLFIGLMACSILASACSAVNEGELSSVYSQFARAIEGQRGHQASELISKSTEVHYAKLRDIALYGSRQRTPLTLYDEIGVYYLRARYDRQQLTKFNGRDIYAILVENGLAGIPNMDDFLLQRISSSGDHATAGLQTNDPSTNYRIAFSYEGGQWKIDDAALRHSRDEVLAFRMVSYKGAREDVIDEILKSVGVRQGLTSQLTSPMVKS